MTGQANSSSGGSQIQVGTRAKPQSLRKTLVSVLANPQVHLSGILGFALLLLSTHPPGPIEPDNWMPFVSEFWYVIAVKLLILYVVLTHVLTMWRLGRRERKLISLFNVSIRQIRKEFTGPLKILREDTDQGVAPLIWELQAVVADTKTHFTAMQELGGLRLLTWKDSGVLEIAAQQVFCITNTLHWTKKYFDDYLDDVAKHDHHRYVYFVYDDDRLETKNLRTDIVEELRQKVGVSNLTGKVAIFHLSSDFGDVGMPLSMLPIPGDIAVYDNIESTRILPKKNPLWRLLWFLLSR